MKKYSIIITAYKEERTLPRLISSLKSQLSKNSEVLVIAPDEPTLFIAKKFAEKDKRIKILKDPRKGKPTALNLGFKKARGELLVLTDGDVVVGKNSIKFLLKHFTDPKVGGVSGRVIYQIPKNSLFYEWAKMSEKIFDKMRRSQDRNNKLWHPTGYLYAVKNGLVTRIPSNTLSDDALIGYLVKSKGYLIKYEPRAKVYVKFPTSISDFVKQKSRTRAGFLQLKKWFGFNGRKILDEVSFGIKDLWKVYGTKRFYKMFFVGLVYIISWLRAYWLIFRGESFEKIWERVETTK
jgi:cellulose synthase/poly-beta-1,6-N-acetylglucosamine synthase-like glycosyltransferase